MLHALNLSLERFLRAEVPLPSNDVDVVFDVPDKEWSGRLTRPTVNVFLQEVRRSGARAVTGLRTRSENGTYHRELLAPFVRVRWCISVWTNDPADELRLLGDLLVVLATAGNIPPEHLVTPIDELGNPVELALAGEDVRPALELWSALQVPPRASIELLAVLPVAPPATREAPAPPDDVSLGVSDRDQVPTPPVPHATGSAAGDSVAGESAAGKSAADESAADESVAGESVAAPVAPSGTPSAGRRSSVARSFDDGVPTAPTRTDTPPGAAARDAARAARRHGRSAVEEAG